MIHSRWMRGQPRQEFLHQEAENLAYTQQRNAAARTSHRRATLRRLQALGLKISCLYRCQRE